MGFFGIFWKGKILSRTLGGGGVLLEILNGGVPRGYPNPDPTSDQKM